MMTVSCGICNENVSKYKCSNCFIPYCSVNCWKKHKTEDDCKIPDKAQKEDKEIIKSYNKKYITEDTVSEEKLIQLGESQNLKRILSNKYLQSTLKAIDNATNPEDALKQAMKDPEFVEFVDECLKIVEDSND